LEIMKREPAQRTIFFREIGHGSFTRMQLKMFVVPIKNVNEAEAEMNGFLRGHRVLAVKKEQRTSNFRR